MPWKNGGGTTTEIAISPAGASMDDFDWRVSMAHVGTDGPFSSFPGIDRTLSIVTGGGITLVFGDGEAVALTQASAPYPFAADRPVEGVLPAGAIDDLNVMSRRGRWSHTVERLIGPGEHHVATDGLLLLIAPEGGWTVDGVTLATGDSALVDGPAEIACVSDGAGGALYVVRLMAAA